MNVHTVLLILKIQVNKIECENGSNSDCTTNSFVI